MEEAVMSMMEGIEQLLEVFQALIEPDLCLLFGYQAAEVGTIYILHCQVGMTILKAIIYELYDIPMPQLREVICRLFESITYLFIFGKVIMNLDSYDQLFQYPVSCAIDSANS